MEAKILIADDEPDQVSALAQVFKEEGYEVRIAIDDHETYYLFDEFQPDLIVLDICFGFDTRMGIDILKNIREKNKNIIIIMLTRLTDARLPPIVFDRDADYFVSKLEETENILALVNRCLRRTKPKIRLFDNCIEINRENKSVKRKTNCAWEEVHLEPMEFKLFIKLVDNCNCVILREVLERFFPDAKNPPATLNKYISELRRKIEPDPDNPQFIRIKKGVGYWFNCNN